MRSASCVRRASRAARSVSLRCASWRSVCLALGFLALGFVGAAPLVDRAQAALEVGAALLLLALVLALTGMPLGLGAAGLLLEFLLLAAILLLARKPFGLGAARFLGFAPQLGIEPLVVSSARVVGLALAGEALFLGLLLGLLARLHLACDAGRGGAALLLRLEVLRLAGEVLPLGLACCAVSLLGEALLLGRARDALGLVATLLLGLGAALLLRLALLGKALLLDLALETESLGAAELLGAARLLLPLQLGFATEASGLGACGLALGLDAVLLLRLAPVLGAARLRLLGGAAEHVGLVGRALLGLAALCLCLGRAHARRLGLAGGFGLLGCLGFLCGFGLPRSLGALRLLGSLRKSVGYRVGLVLGGAGGVEECHP